MIIAQAIALHVVENNWILKAMGKLLLMKQLLWKLPSRKQVHFKDNFIELNYEDGQYQP